MNKHLFIIISLLLFITSSSFGQTKIEKYCEILVKPKQFFQVYLGERADLFNFKDSSVLHQLRKVSEFKTVLDVMNYMASIGWVGEYNYNRNLLGWYFKKSFDTSELINTTN